MKEKILLMISNFVNEEIIENEINNFGNNILFFYEFLSIIEKYNDFYFLNNIINYLEKENKNSALVIVPHEYLQDLTESDAVETKVLDKNAELNIVAVQIK